MSSRTLTELTEMNLGKTIGIFGLCAAMLVSGCQMGGPNSQDIANVEDNQPKAELVIEDSVHTLSTVDSTTFYNPVHQAGHDAIQKETNNAGISTMAPTEIAEHLNSPSVEGSIDAETGDQNFSARFTSAETGANFEVICTNQGIGSGIILDATSPITILQNGIALQQTAGRISSNWVKVGQDDCHCVVESEGMTMGQTAHMAGSLQTFNPVQVGGAYIAQ